MGSRRIDLFNVYPYLISDCWSLLDSDLPKLHNRVCKEEEGVRNAGDSGGGKVARVAEKTRKMEERGKERKQGRGEVEEEKERI